MVRKIHLIFKTHLDVGFTDYASVVVNNYFSSYIPASLRVAREMRESGKTERFIWTTGSWLIYEYLEQATGAADIDALLRSLIAEMPASKAAAEASRLTGEPKGDLYKRILAMKSGDNG